MKNKAIGWLILLAALGVPALFFYNFLVKMRTSTAPYEANGAPDGSAFGGVRSQPDGGLPNPIQSSSSYSSGGFAAQAQAAPLGQGGGSGPEPVGAAAPAKRSEGGGPEPMVAAAPVRRGEGGGPQPERAAAPQGQEQPSAPAPDAQPQGAPRPAPGGSSDQKGAERIEYLPQTERDPTVSVLDQQSIELEAQRRLEEEERARLASSQKKVKRVRTARPVSDLIEVQGIISMSSGNAAIVNEETRRVGDRDKRSGCTITRVTSNQVFFRCGSRNISKTVEQ